MVYPKWSPISAAGRAYDRKSSPVTDRRSTTVPRNQPPLSLWRMTGRRQTFGYLPSQWVGVLPLSLGRYSVPVLLRIGGWVGVIGLHTKTIYPTNGHPSQFRTNRARRRVTYCRAEMYAGRVLPPGESRCVCRRNRQTDGRKTVILRFPLHAVSLIKVNRY